MIKFYNRPDNVYEVYTNGAAEYAPEKVISFAVKRGKV